MQNNNIPHYQSGTGLDPITNLPIEKAPIQAPANMDLTRYNEMLKSSYRKGQPAGLEMDPKYNTDFTQSTYQSAFRNQC